jgi:tripartite-type tricarboxylate transporter receptor subunit TctC
LEVEAWARRLTEASLCFPLGGMKESDTNLFGVEYEGIASPTPDLLAGRVDVLFNEIAVVSQHAHVCNLWVLAVAAGPHRLSHLPSVLTTVERGLLSPRPD